LKGGEIKMLWNNKYERNQTTPPPGDEEPPPKPPEKE